MSLDHTLAELVWYDELSHEERLEAIMNDNRLCVYVSLFEKESSPECIELCKTVWEFREL